MKNTFLFLLTVASLLVLTSRIYTLAEGNSSPRDTLRTMKEQNQKLIEQQNATLQKLDDVAKDATQMRTFSRRT